MGGPVFDESGRYVGRTEPDDGPLTIIGWIRERAVWHLVGWGLFFAFFFCLGALFLLLG